MYKPLGVLAKGKVQKLRILSFREANQNSLQPIQSVKNPENNP
jgi:hypothetical protein